MKLSQLAPLATGHLRAVFAHPDNPDWLVKIMRPEVVVQRWGGWRRWPKRLPRARHYSSYLREIKEYIAIMARHPDGDPPLVRLRGIVETDLGLGLVMERINDPEGRLAPNLHDVLRAERSMSPWLEAELEKLFVGLQRHDVVLGDMHPGNVVYGRPPGGGERRLIVIDGFGEKHLVPYCSMSRQFNHWHNLRMFARLRRKLGGVLTGPGAVTTE
jgi:hypothetical protein